MQATNSTPQRPRVVVVLGAGADRVYGIPMVPTLLSELANWAQIDGKPVSAVLRKQLPHLRFTFDKLAGDSTDSFLSNLFSGDVDQVKALRTAIKKLKAHVDYTSVGEVVETLCNMAEQNLLAGPQLAALSGLIGTAADMGDAEPLLDPRGISLTELPMSAIRSTFHRALMEGPALTDDERSALELFIASVSNIEQLLSHFFTLFCAGRPQDQKTYLYIVWMLWAYLRTKSSGLAPRDKAIYAQLPRLASSVITFNYTNFFLAPTLSHVYHFHGNLDQVLRMDDRRLVDIKGTGTNSPHELASFAESLRLDVTESPHLDLPAIVPPISFKPLMSRQQLRTWATADDLLANADVILVVGYSFAAADEHFNDLLRNSKGRVLVVNPSLESTVQAASLILGIDSTDLSTKVIAGHDAMTSRRLTVIGATAEDVGPELIGACLE
jgi:hypothetical protein